jgi:menaquinol-cytochrome c reductase iron-sulfur subunit
VEPSREHLHAPGQSLWPVGFAVGVAAFLVGFVVSWTVVALGGVIAVVFAGLWIRDLVRGSSLAETHAFAPETRANRPASREPVPPLAELRADTHVSRSVFLELSTLGLGGVIGGLVSLPVLGFMVAPAFLKQGVKQHDLGPMSGFAEGQFVITTFTSNPSEGFVSRVTAFVRNNGLLGNLPSFTILSSRCVHLGCPVQPNGVPATAQETHFKDVTLIPVLPSGFGCPCHDSQYDTEGNRTSGPAPRALDRYSYSIVNGHLLVGSPFSVAYVVGVGAQAQVHETGYAFPGEHVDGIESWLYPIQPPH